MGPSSHSALALDLAVSDKALSAPPIPLPSLAKIGSASELFRKARFITENTIEDEKGVRYYLGKPFANGAFGAVMMLNKPDPLVDQDYVAKIIRLKPERESVKNFQEKLRIPSFKGKKESPINIDKLKVTEREALISEIDIMLAIDSRLIHRVVLDLEDFAILFLSAMVCDGFDVADKLRELQDKKVTHFDARSEKQVQKQMAPKLIDIRSAQADVALAIFENSLPTLKKLHDSDRVHRDIKLENFLVDSSGKFHVADFGIATDISIGGFRGTLGYMPFEQLIAPERNKPGFLLKKGDIWALGTAALEALTGRILCPEDIENGCLSVNSPRAQKMLSRAFENYRELWNEASRKQTFEDIYNYLDARKKFDSTAGMFCDILTTSTDLYELVMLSLTPSPEERPSVDQLMNLMEILSAEKKAAGFGELDVNIKDIVKSNQLGFKKRTFAEEARSPEIGFLIKSKPYVNSHSSRRNSVLVTMNATNEDDRVGWSWTRPESYRSKPYWSLFSKFAWK